jgi:tRNA(Ile)-lysidine synthase
MLNRLTAFIRRYDMVQPGDRVVAAVSGGADSVALLWSLYLLKDKLGITLEAAHYNHHLRGEESQRDEDFVRDLCDRFDIPLHLGGGTVVSGEKGLEAAARTARYAFFDTLPGKIATAHTADDNAETVLMRMVRGTGLKGLGAIAPIRGRVIRPMLTVTRQDVLALLEEYHLQFVEDSSNGTDEFLRNRLRHGVMPLLKAENPALSENLSEMALRLREDEQVLDDLALLEDQPDVESLRQMSSAVRRRILSKFLERSGVKEPEGSHILLAEKLVFSPKPSAKAQFPGGVTITRNYGVLTAVTAEPTLTAVELTCPGRIELPQIGLAVICTPADDMLDEPNCFSVIPNGRLMLRQRLPGDEIRLRGGSKSVKKLFIDRKIPAFQRPLIPVIADEGGVVGVYDIGAHRDRLGCGVTIRFTKI